MTDNELLLAISTIMDKKIQPLEHQMDSMETSLNNRMDSMETSLNNRIDSVEASLRACVRSINLTLENVVLPRLNEIETCYVSTYKRYKDSVEQIDQLQVDMSVVKHVLIEHGEQLQKIS